MDIARVGSVRAFRIDGAVEHILLGWGKFDAHNLLVTWTEVSPGSHVRGHAHAGSEQVYVIIKGAARMQVGEERALVASGTLVYVPPGIPHSIANPGDEPLVFLSAASPPYSVERLYADRGIAMEEAEPVYSL